MYVAVKDSISQPSSALRHATENSHLIGSSGKAIVASITDRGPSHNCPGNSWANPTQRIMSVLNLALSGVSLSREEMSKEKEELIKTPTNMKEMRAAAEKNPDVKVVINDSLQKPLSILNNRFSQLSLKGSQFQILPPASDEQIHEQFLAVHEIDESIKVDETLEERKAAGMV